MPPGRKTPLKDELIAILAQCEDFKNEKPVVAKIAEKVGHRVVYLPKFHCELNPIERVWCYAKRLARQRCDYTYQSLKTNVEACLDEVSLQCMRRFCRSCRDYGRAYMDGASSTTVEEKRKIYKSHRRVNA
eukprot:Pompholyxophrys_punicea_v1_NODE_802_length_1271_cov_14.558824.p2 type:complete len:131 gc:universal NODE_802_length_1271_cov_14.558824:540-932(+)